MKRKLSAFLVILCIIFGLSAFTACSNSKDNVITNNEFTVTFNSNGGSEISPFKGTILETLPTPTKAGFAFDGWYSTADLSGTAQTAPLNLVADISLFAKWKIAHEHAYGEWVVTMPATCTTAGTRTKTCTVCGEKVTETIPALGGTHNYGEWVVTPATCTTAGTRTKTCSVCGDVQTEVIPATGHTFGDWVVTPATCTKEGLKTKTCTVCGEKLTEVIPAGHTFGDWVITTSATCATEGERTKTCSVCGEKVTEVIPAIGHSFGEWVITPATCTKEGLKTKTCSVCGEKLTEVIPAGHTFGDWIETETGMTRECMVCHHKEVATYTTGLQFEDVDVNGTMVHMVSDIGSAKGAISIPNIHDGKPVGGIKDYAFNGYSSLTSIVIPSSVTSIGNYAFYGCKNLTTVTFAEGSMLGSIGNDAFCDCASLTSIIIPNSVTSIEREAFSGCTNLSTVTFAEGSMLTSIEDKAFRGCASLTSITIPSSVFNIGYDSFEGCTSLANISVAPNNARYQSIDGNLYNKAGTALLQYAIGKTATSVFIPSNVYIRSYAFLGCASLNSIKVDQNNANYRSIDGNLYDKEVTRLIQYAIAKTATSFTVPNIVKYIENDAFRGCTSLTSINIPSSVTSIGDRAFSGCTNLTTVTFAEGSKLTSIGGSGYLSGAFYNCTSLTSINIPSSVTSIGSHAFYGCTNLSTVTFAEGSKLTSIGDSAFRGCTSLTSIIIPSSVTSINDCAFFRCINLSTVTFAEGSKLTSIGGSAFFGCASLTSIIIPSSVTSIGGETFVRCTNLSTVTFAEGSMLDSIGFDAFGGCTSLTNITIPSTVTSIGQWAFSRCTSLTSIIIPSSVTTIGDYAFEDCASLTCITVDPNNANYQSIEGTLYDKAVTKLMQYALANTATSITVPSSVTSIEARAFKGCTNLSTVTFAEGSKLTSIGWIAFRGCFLLTSITIPSSVTIIEDLAFMDCASLIIYAEATEKQSGWSDSWNHSRCAIVWNCKTNDVTDNGYIYTVIDGLRYSIKNGEAMVEMQTRTITTANIAADILYKGNSYPVTGIGALAFCGCTSLTSITIPSSVKNIWTQAFAGCTSLTSFMVDQSNADYQSIDGNLYNKSGTTLIQYAIGKTAVSFNIPSKVTSIWSDAFAGCTSLTSITVDSSNADFQSIHGNLYNKAGTMLIQYAVGKTATSFIIPSSVSSIGEFAFSGCISLTSIIIPSAVTDIGNNAFGGCTNLSTVTFAEGSKLTYIGYGAFSGCTSLISIRVPSSVTDIMIGAFYGCISLTSIIIPSGVSRIENDIFDGCTSLTIYVEAPEKPSEWYRGNFSNRPVYWFSATAPTDAPALGAGYWRYVDGVPTKW